MPCSVPRRALFAGLAAPAIARAATAPAELLNASYDPTRELYRRINAAFALTHPTPVAVRTTHGGSADQARAVIAGLEADVVTLALAHDIDAIAAAGLIAPDWQQRLPDHAAPYTSTVVFLVRRGNPRRIESWEDLTRADVKVITPNPKTSGGARWNFLAAYAAALDFTMGNETRAADFLRRLFRNVPVLESGARGATLAFTERGLGDVLIAWESEAYLALAEAGAGRFEIVTPPTSILAEPTVAVVDRVVDRRGTRALAEAYLRFLYTEAGQEICARNFYRPRDASVAARFASRFAPVSLFTIDERFGGWARAHARCFADGALFDQVARTS